ncbi:uncharacterized protein EAF02_006649 [Botrytis sinoallii]|uniref:uncharacterized protein n=1 Tax=Botrytis sinoallii TaxID=1463999 RepID=UPI0018FF6B71|nr:uncharacterized protein EAF02_006649 [Botrytis sinoallii]KAF7881961.1 hypothetical protein EAF02_006649 [Botrytis sinoallii]
MNFEAKISQLRGSFVNSSHTDDEEEEFLKHSTTSRKTESGPWFQRRKVFLVTNIALIIITLIQGLFIAQLRIELSHQLPKFSPNGLSYARDNIRIAHVPTRFWNDDEEEEDKSWTAIEAGHGLVSVAPEWAAARGLPDSLIHPRDSSKRVYVIEGYHGIHCLQTLRRHYMNLRRGETPDRPLEHDLHCFDSLRQSIMCMANDELLYTTGHNDAGINQTRQCRDWDALREWASGFTSCYHDYVAPSGETKWGKCDNGVDGLPYGSLLS